MAGRKDSMPPNMTTHFKHGPGYDYVPTVGSLAPIEAQTRQRHHMLPGLAELTTGVSPYSTPASLIETPGVNAAVGYPHPQLIGSKRQRSPDLLQAGAVCDPRIPKRPKNYQQQRQKQCVESGPYGEGSYADTTHQETVYQYLEYLALEPSHVVPGRPHIFTFSFTNEMTSRMAGSKEMHIRLQCFAKNPGTKVIPKEQWGGKETAWHKHIELRLNGRPLTAKPQQPIDIEQHVCSGVNTLHAYIVPENSAAPTTHLLAAHFIAVEVITTVSRSHILNSIPTIPPNEALANIQERLKGSFGDADVDELYILTDHIRIGMTDPFNFCLLKTPVRGRTCRHLECFDLETWLATHPTECNYDNRGKVCQVCPSAVYNWKCPICGGDTRPQELQINGFLSDIIAQLQNQTAKSITVRADGAWTSD